MRLETFGRGTEAEREEGARRKAETKAAKAPSPAVQVVRARMPVTKTVKRTAKKTAEKKIPQVNKPSSGKQSR